MDLDEVDAKLRKYVCLKFGLLLRIRLIQKEGNMCLKFGMLVLRILISWFYLLVVVGII